MYKIPAKKKAKKKKVAIKENKVLYYKFTRK